MFHAVCLNCLLTLDILFLFQHELEDALGKLCIRFQPDRYEQVQDAYAILGKTQVGV